MVLHKDSKWYQQWKDFKDNNVVFNRKCSKDKGVARYFPSSDSRCVGSDAICATSLNIMQIPAGFLVLSLLLGGGVNGTWAEVTTPQLFQAPPSVFGPFPRSGVAFDHSLLPVGTKTCFCHCLKRNELSFFSSIYFSSVQLCSGTGHVCTHTDLFSLTLSLEQRKMLFLAN